MRDPDQIEFPALGILFYGNARHAVIIDHYDTKNKYYYVSDTADWTKTLFPENRIPDSYLRDSINENSQGLLRIG